MKLLIKLELLFLLIAQNACQQKDTMLFEVSEQENGFISMAESSTFIPIKPDSLAFFLTDKELASKENLTFKKAKNLHQNKTFKLIVLLKEKIGAGKNYTFIIRTFDRNFKIIDSFELGNWIDAEKKYCFGSINNHLILTKTCDNGKFKDVQQILTDGSIVATSYHGRE